jgi:hypothetical protein
MKFTYELGGDEFSLQGRKPHSVFQISVVKLSRRKRFIIIVRGIFYRLIREIKGLYARLSW